MTATTNDRAGGAQNVGIQRRREGALGAERGAQNERRSVGVAAVAGAALVDAVEVCGVGADSPQRAGPIEAERVSTPGRTKEPGIQASGEGEGVPRLERRVPEANHKSRARAKIAARIRERASGLVVDRREGARSRACSKK